MDYVVGSRVKVRLYSGRIVDAQITAVIDKSSGRRIQIHYQGEVSEINPQQILEVLP
jgi:hypothetical protein